ncbi:alpha/beta fold hydrolase [Leuconostoc mesenteroides]|uniref:alpha/beta hydrolase n=1 Tax=Leuconostoc mesenteroides TaxID=1245 RepID=UPI001CBDCF17|nr:alpha/beta fold hydrolase [Leuconostoc mesenteroides]MBZ1511183.1 alpha/beta fold hydrolase [Leuconostoc mesenteroides]MBZ1541578.1 alpha/beta fold hydrolase [Leuconostoc mesenteroides]
MEKLEFKQGMYNLNPEPNFNFQLNRVILWDGGDLKDVMQVAQKITDSTSWKREMIGLGDYAFSQNRISQAIAYYRMSEFFIVDGDSDKKKYYIKATEMFYEYFRSYFDSGRVQKLQVSYEDIMLPVMFAKAQKQCSGTILLHGGNDSYFEEMFLPMLYLSEQGYDVYMFEGPGQGGVLRIQGKHFTHEWERPVKAILDFFHLNDIIIIGVSLGGMLAPRAAAFDKRITKVVAWSVFPDFLDVVLDQIPAKVAGIVRFMLKNNIRVLLSPILRIMKSIRKNDPLFQWGVNHGMYAYEANSIYDYLKIIGKYQIMDVAPLIEQDVLILGANQDHFVNYRMIGKEINALTNVRSLTFRLFTEKENAGNHCNLGNAKLALETILQWLTFLKQRDSEIENK